MIGPIFSIPKGDRDYNPQIVNPYRQEGETRFWNTTRISKSDGLKRKMRCLSFSEWEIFYEVRVKEVMALGEIWSKLNWRRMGKSSSSLERKALVLEREVLSDWLD